MVWRNTWITPGIIGITCLFGLMSCEQGATPLSDPKEIEKAALTAKPAPKQKVSKAAKGKNQKGLNQYQSDTGLKLQYPAKWQAKPTATGQIFLSQMGKKDDFQETVELATEKISSKQTAEGYLKQAQSNLGKLFKNFKVIKQGQLKTANGTTVPYMHYSFEQGKAKRMASMHVTVKGAKAYVLTGTATPKSFKNFNKKFDAIAGSVQFTAH